jgi:hypothetical protein
MAAPIEVSPVAGRAALARFLTFPWSIYGDDADWVPQPLSFDRKVLAPDGPFFAHADGQLLLAERGGEVVGRLLVAMDHLDPDQGCGTFGYFEAIDDEAVARALFEEGERYLRSRGARQVRGPVSPSSNLGPPGLYVEGDPGPPGPLMAHHAAYYPGLLEAAGYGKEKDLLALRASTDEVQVEEGLKRLPELEQKGYRFRTSQRRRLGEDLRLLRSIRNHVYTKTGHYLIAPMTDAEIDLLFHEFKTFLDPELLVFVERAGQPVGACLGLPDVTPVLQALDGRLGPIRILRALLARRHVASFQVRDLVFDPEEKVKYLALAAAQLVVRNGRDKGYRRVEYCWVVEDNIASLWLLKRIGGRVAKRFRVYDKVL